MLKASMSLAVLCLLGNISATQLQRPHAPHNFAQKGARWEAGKFYNPTEAGRLWHELDDHTERLHGTEQQDEDSPYDPDVVDAPEDMPRVGNDHEVLHNAKLSPNGYYNGFFHKDFAGNFAQKTHHHHHHHKHHDNAHVQVQDHKNDTDDIVEDTTFLNIYDHGNDTEDIPDGLEPFQAVQLIQKNARNHWDQVYAQEDDEQSYELLQEKYEHENDTEDIPENLDPVDINNIKIKGGFSLAQKQQNDELDQIVRDSGEDDLVQLNDLSDEQDVFLSFDPHENDTDDIAEEVNPMMYDKHHSKMWNEAVSKKALEMENDIKIEENMVLAQQKAKVEAERKASIIRFNEEQEKKRFTEKKQEIEKHPEYKENPYKTIDLSELYSAMA